MQPFVMNRAQRTVHEKLSAQLKDTGRIRAIVLKARQEGISTYVAGRFFRRVSLYANQTALIVADQKKRGAVLFDIYENFHRRAPEWLRATKRYGSKSQQLWYDTPDGSGLNSKIVVETAMDAAAGRGTTLQCIHASEMAFWERPEDVWVALMQAVPDEGSEVIIESTANGVGNYFHQVWEDAVNGENDYVPIFLPWWIHEEYFPPIVPDTRDAVLGTLSEYEQQAMDVGFEWEGERHRLTPEHLAWRRRTIREKLAGDERAFRQEYPSTAREAFLVSGNMYFDEDALLRYEQGSIKAPRFRFSKLADGTIPRPDPNGPLRVWEMPRREGRYVIFADTATGRQTKRETTSGDGERGGRDFSSADVFDVLERKYVAQLHGRIVPEVFAHQLKDLGYMYPSRNPDGSNRPALIGVERNHSSGETVLRILRDDMKYPNLYFHRLLNRRNNRPGVVLGWMTTVENRMPLLDEFAQALREDSIWYPNPDGIRECFTFVRGDDGKPEAQEGCHDDRVISGAGCLQMARFYRAPAIGEPPKLKVGSSPTGLFD